MLGGNCSRRFDTRVGLVPMLDVLGNRGAAAMLLEHPSMFFAPAMSMCPVSSCARGALWTRLVGRLGGTLTG